MDKTLVLTGYNPDFKHIASLTVPRLRSYADRHGFAVHIHSEMDAGPLPTSWAKIEMIRRALSEGVPNVFWIDADALMIRLDADIRDHVEKDADLHIAWHGPSTARILWPDFQPHYNAGVMFVRNSEWSRDFFDRVWAWRGKIQHFWSDQAAIHRVLGRMSILGFGPDVQAEVNCEKLAHLQCTWNSIPGGVTVSDPIIRHYAGLGEERAQLIKSDILLQTLGPDSLEKRMILADHIDQITLQLRLVYRRSQIAQQEAKHKSSDIAELRDENTMVRSILDSTRIALNQALEDGKALRLENSRLRDELALGGARHWYLEKLRKFIRR